MRYIGVYKDGPSSRIRYFGPFVSQAITEEFLNDLPEPLPGGAKSWKPLQPYMHHETGEATRSIMEERERAPSQNGEDELAAVVAKVRHTMTQIKRNPLIHVPPSTAKRPHLAAA